MLRVLRDVITATYGNPACDQAKVAILQEACGQLEVLSSQYLIPKEGRPLQAMSHWRNGITDCGVRKVNQKIGDCIYGMQ
jgi:hypothetical protein